MAQTAFIIRYHRRVFEDSSDAEKPSMPFRKQASRQLTSESPIAAPTPEISNRWKHNRLRRTTMKTAPPPGTRSSPGSAEKMIKRYADERLDGDPAQTRTGPTLRAL